MACMVMAAAMPRRRTWGIVATLYTPATPPGSIAHTVNGGVTWPAWMRVTVVDGVTAPER